MPLSREDIQNIIAKQLPGFTIVDEPVSDAPGLFTVAEASTPDFRKIQEKLGKNTTEHFAATPHGVSTDDVTTVSVRSPDNPTEPAAGSQLKYVFLSTKNGDILAIQG